MANHRQAEPIPRHKSARENTACFNGILSFSSMVFSSIASSPSGFKPIDFGSD